MSLAEGPAIDIMVPIRAAVVRYFALLAGAVVLLLLVSAPFREESPTVIASYCALLVVFSVAYRVRNTHPMLAGALCSLGPLALVSIMVNVRGGIVNPAAVTSYVTLIATTGLCWNSRGTVVVGVLSSAVLGYFVATGPADVPYNKLQQWVELAFQLLIVSGIVRLTLRALTRSGAETLSQQKRFEDAVEGAAEAIIGLDPEGKIQIFNRRAAQLSGVSAELAKGSALESLNWFSPVGLDVVGGFAESAPMSSQRVPLEVSALSGDRLEVSVSLITPREGEPNRLITIRDVTERERAREAQEALEARIAHSRSIDALGRLAGGVAHDFNNLLTVISGTVEMMRRDDGKQRSLEPDLDLIEGAADRAAKLTGQLLAFGRKQVLQPAVLAPQAVLSGLESMLRRLVPASIDLRLISDPEVCNVRADESRLEQVVVNLVSNAVDAMPQGGVLTISIRNVALSGSDVAGRVDARPGDFVELAVLDTGSGIDQVTQAKLFEPFFTTKDLGKGTGLGLPMVQGIVAQSGGFMLVDSAPGQGSKFRVLLPPTDEELAPVSAELPAPTQRGALARVLLVEDEEEVRKSTQRMLESLGYQVDTAEDGRAAIARFGSAIGEFQVLVSDVVMPHVGGLELAERLKSQHPNLRVLFISGYTEEAIGGEDELSMGTDYLTKPFKRQALAAKLGDLGV